MKKHGKYQEYSFYVEKEFTSFLSSATHTYNCIVSAIKLDIGEGVIEMEAELDELIGGGKKSLITINSDWKRYCFKVNGEPEDFVRKVFTDKMMDFIRKFDEMHMSYHEGYFFLVRPMPRTVELGISRTKYVYPPFVPGVFTVLELDCHRLWDAQCKLWIDQIIDQLE